MGFKFGRYFSHITLYANNNVESSYFHTKDSLTQNHAERNSLENEVLYMW